MDTISSIPEPLLRTWVGEQLGVADTASIRLTRIASGKFNTSFFVDAPGGEFVLRVAPPPDAVFVFYEWQMMRQEPSIHDLLRRHTSVPVARVVAFDGSLRRVPRDCMLMERLPGTAVSDAPVAELERVLCETGRYLAETHALTAAQYGYLGDHRPMVPQATWRDAFAIMWNKLLDDVAETGHYSAEEADDLRRLLDRHRGVFDYAGPARLLHMDVWAQNILADPSGRVTGLVDWDRALWGDPEIEFAVLDYCGISEPSFWEGYGAERDRSPAAETRRLFYLLYEIQKYIVIRHGRSGDPDSARSFRNRALQMARRLR